MLKCNLRFNNELLFHLKACWMVAWLAGKTRALVLAFSTNFHPFKPVPSHHLPFIHFRQNPTGIVTDFRTTADM